MSRRIEIRAYRPEDDAALVELVRELQAYEAVIYDRLVPASEIGRWYVERLLKDCAEHKGEIRIAECDGRIAGYATILTDVVVADERDEVTYSHAYLGDLCVTAGDRARGIGRLLLADCETIARRAGARWLRITAHAANARARQVYQACGFREQFINFEKNLD